MSPFITTRQVVAAAAIAAAISLPTAIASPGDGASDETAAAASTMHASKADRLPVRARLGCAWPYTSGACDASAGKAPRTIVVDHNVAKRTTVVARMPAKN